VDEGIEDEFVGIINYSIMAMIQLDNPTTEGKYEMAADTAISKYASYASETKELMQRKNHDYGDEGTQDKTDRRE